MASLNSHGVVSLWGEALAALSLASPLDSLNNGGRARNVFYNPPPRFVDFICPIPCKGMRGNPEKLAGTLPHLSDHLESLPPYWFLSP